MTPIDAMVGPVDLAPYVHDVLNMIVDDMQSGQLPARVDTFTALHGHVDANMYALMADVPFPAGEFGFLNAVDEAVGRALTRGEHYRILAMSASIDGLSSCRPSEADPTG